MKKFTSDVDWFETMNTSPFKRMTYFSVFQQKVEENMLDSEIRQLINNEFEDKIKLDPNPESKRYAVIMATKSTDGRAYTYSIVDLIAATKEDSYCQFDDYTDLLINLSLHLKTGKEEESVMQAVSLVIGGAMRRTK
jgi:hypothetical protein